MEITFKVEFINQDLTNFGVIKTDMRQHFGKFSGSYFDNEIKLEFREIAGFAEIHKAKW